MQITITKWQRAVVSLGAAALLIKAYSGWYDREGWVIALFLGIVLLAVAMSPLGAEDGRDPISNAFLQKDRRAAFVALGWCDEEFKDQIAWPHIRQKIEDSIWSGSKSSLSQFSKSRQDASNLMLLEIATVCRGMMNSDSQYDPSGSPNSIGLSCVSIFPKVLDFLSEEEAISNKRSESWMNEMIDIVWKKRQKISGSAT